MKPSKVFFLLIIILTASIIFLDWMRHRYFPVEIISPIARIKAIVVIVGGIIIMKLTFTKKGFKLFLILYLALWLIYWVLSFMFAHNICTPESGEIFLFYKDILQLISPLPFIFFWFVDNLFFVERKLKS